MYYIVLQVPCSLVIACCKRADFLALLCVLFSFVFVTFRYGVLGLVWYLIESIIDLCLFLYFLITNIKFTDLLFVVEVYFTNGSLLDFGQIMVMIY